MATIRYKIPKRNTRIWKKRRKVEKTFGLSGLFGMITPLSYGNELFRDPNAYVSRTRTTQVGPRRNKTLIVYSTRIAQARALADKALLYMAGQKLAEFRKMGNFNPL